MDQPSGARYAAHAVGMLVRPGRTWDAVDGEPADARSLITRYVAPLAAIPAVGGVAGPLIFGVSIANIGVHVSVVGLVLSALTGWAVTLAAVCALALFVDVIAPAVGGRRDLGQALKLVAYAGTASWVAGFAEIYPNLGLPVAVLAGLYSLYALFLGLPRLMGVPAERRLIAFAVILLAVLSLLMLRGALASRAAELGGPLSASYAPPR